MPKSGIYKIAIDINKAYIGSSVDIDRRKEEHIDMLRQGKHHSHLLQAAYNKNGRRCRFSIVERCSPDRLELRERHHIRKVWGQGRSLNVVVPGHPRWNQALRQTPKTGQKKRRSRSFRLPLLLKALWILFWMAIGWGVAGFWFAVVGAIGSCLVIGGY